MKELLVIAATIATEEQLLDDLIENAQKVKLLDDNKEYKHRLALQCQLWLIRLITNGDMDKSSDLIKRMNQDEQRSSLFNINPS